MKIKLILLVWVVTVASLSLANFPAGSVVNFNPAYMVNNSKWSFSYETYFNDGMDFVVFQPFENGFAGKLGVYADKEGNGLLYSVASKRGNLALGGDFTLSNVGTHVGVEIGLGMLEKITANFYLDLRIPQAVSYVYNLGVKVHPNVRGALAWETKNWNIAAFGGIDYPWVKGGAWGSLSLLGFQLFGYLETGYNSSLSDVTKEEFDVVLQYTLSSVKTAYIYDYISSTSNNNQSKYGIRISVDW